MTTPAKYMFDTELDRPAGPPPIAFDKVEAMKKAHQDELQKAREAAFAEGKEAGRQETLATIENRLSEQLEQLIAARDNQIERVDNALQEIRSSAVQIAVEAAKKLAGELLNRYPAEHVERVFKQCLTLLPNTVMLRVLVNPELAEPLTERLEEHMLRGGHQNPLQVIADENVKGADCNIIWTEGGIKQSSEHIRAQIDEVVEAYLAAQDDAAAEPASEN